MGQAEDALSCQLRNNDLVMARLVANVVGEALHERVALLEHAGRPSPPCSKPPDRQPGRNCGPAYRHSRPTSRRSAAAARKVSSSNGPWPTAPGFIIADEFEEPELHDKSFAWRDWFNGTGHKPRSAGNNGSSGRADAYLAALRRRGH